MYCPININPVTKQSINLAVSRFCLLYPGGVCCCTWPEVDLLLIELELEDGVIASMHLLSIGRMSSVLIQPFLYAYCNTLNSMII